MAVEETAAEVSAATVAVLQVGPVWSGHAAGGGPLVRESSSAAADEAAARATSAGPAGRALEPALLPLDVLGIVSAPANHRAESVTSMAAPGPGRAALTSATSEDDATASRASPAARSLPYGPLS
jgi:hypothetical protein